MTQEHTPTPWAVCKEAGNNGFASTIAGHFTKKFNGEISQYTIGHLGRIGESVNATDEANAAFIVRACNRDHVFDELVEALTDAVIATASDHAEDPWSLRARALLAKARGEA